MLKEKNRNIKLWYVMKRTRTFSGSEESSIPMRSRSIKRPEKKGYIIAKTMQTSVLFAIRSKVVPKARPQTKGTKELSGYFLVRKLISVTTTGWKRTPPKARLPSKIFCINFQEIAPIESILHGLIGCQPKKRPMSQTIHSSDDSILSKHRLGMRPTILLR